MTLESYITGSRGTLVFGAGVPAITATIKQVGDGFIVARSVELDRSPAGEELELEYVIPLSSVVYFRRTLNA